MSDQPLVSINEARQLAGVSRRTIYYWMDQNYVQWVFTAGSQRRIVAATLFRPGNVTPGTVPIGSAHGSPNDPAVPEPAA